MAKVASTKKLARSLFAPSYPHEDDSGAITRQKWNDPSSPHQLDRKNVNPIGVSGVLQNMEEST